MHREKEAISPLRSGGGDNYEGVFDVCPARLALWLNGQR
jgi:hypothetical protein